MNYCRSSLDSSISARCKASDVKLIKPSTQITLSCDNHQDRHHVNLKFSL